MGTLGLHFGVPDSLWARQGTPEASRLEKGSILEDNCLPLGSNFGNLFEENRYKTLLGVCLSPPCTEHRFLQKITKNSRPGTLKMLQKHCKYCIERNVALSRQKHAKWSSRAQFWMALGTLWDHFGHQKAIQRRLGARSEF